MYMVWVDFMATLIILVTTSHKTGVEGNAGENIAYDYITHHILTCGDARPNRSSPKSLVRL